MSRGTSNCSSKPCRNPVESSRIRRRVSTSVTTFLKLCCHHCRNPTPASIGFDSFLTRFRQLFDVSNFSGKVADINPHQFCIGIFELSSTFIFIFISQQSPACVTHCLCCLSVPLPQVPGRRHFKPYMVSIWKHQMWPGFLGRFLRLNIFGFVEVKLKSRVFAIAVCLIHGVHRN